MQHGEMLREHLDFSYRVHQRLFHVPADGARRFGNQENTAATPRFRGDQGTPLLNAGQNENITLPHEFRHVLAVAKDFNGWMGKHGGELLGIPGYELPGYLECPTVARRR